MMFDRLANVIQRRAKLIVVLWVVALVCMGFFALKSGEVMSYDINSQASDDSESVKGLNIIEDYFPSSDIEVTAMPILVLYYENEAELAEAQRFLEAFKEATGADERFGEVTSMDPTSDTGPGIIMAMIPLENMTEDEATAYTPELRKYISGIVQDTGFQGAEYLSGNTSISYDMKTNSAEDISKIDPFTVLMILVLVGLFFRSFVTSATPPMTIGFAFIVTMGLIYFIGQFLNIFYITNMMILVSMMGAGCDYCIFIIARYREELRKGLSHDEAVHQSIVWAGESITISGASVMIGFGAMSVSSYGMISMMGVCLALGILVALIAALTLITSMLQLLGDRIFWPTKLKEYQPGGKATKGWYAKSAAIGNRYFHGSIRFSLKHAKAIVVATIVVTVPAVYLMNESEDSYDMITAMLSGESGDGMNLISNYADQGMVMPNYTIIEYDQPIGVATKTGNMLGTMYWNDYWKNTVSPTLGQLYDRIDAIDNIAYVERIFVWDDLIQGIKHEGITDTQEKIQYVKDHLTSKNAMIFQKMVDKLEEEDFNIDYLFEGPGAMIEDELEDADVDFSWDGTIQEAQAMGITDTDEILDYVMNKFGATVADKFRSEIEDQMEENDMDADMFIYGPGYVMAKKLKDQGFKFDWDQAVQAARDKGITSSDLIVEDVVSQMGYAIQDGFVDKIRKNFKDVSDERLVNGLGPEITAMIQEQSPFPIDYDWDQKVQEAIESTHSNDPSVILNAMKTDSITTHIVETVQEYLEAMHISESIAVFGFGPMIDSALSGTVTLKWKDMIYVSRAKGYAEPADIVTDILTSYGKEVSDQAIVSVRQGLDEMDKNDISRDMLVNGIGSMLDEKLENFDIDLRWDEVVADVKTMGYNTSKQMLDKVLDIYEVAISDAAIKKIDDSMEDIRENDMSTDIMVYGFGPLMDYVMNVSNKAIGGEFAASEDGRGNVSFILLTSATKEAAMSPISMESISEIKNATDIYLYEHGDLVVNHYNTGTAVVMHDVADTVKAQFTSIEILVVILIALLLFFVMKSYLIPIRSVLTILMSISWTLAAMDIVFVHLLGMPVVWLIPIILLVICLGLGMDYDILLTTRIRENALARGMSNDDAIYDAVMHTGSVITICGLIMGGAFGTLMISGIPMLKQFGFALCFAILVDALIVRTYIVPAVMHLLGDLNWKGPKFLNKSHEKP